MPAQIPDPPTPDNTRSRLRPKTDKSFLLLFFKKEALSLLVLRQASAAFLKKAAKNFYPSGSERTARALLRTRQW
jgi:hypothetical protein